MSLFSTEYAQRWEKFNANKWRNMRSDQEDFGFRMSPSSDEYLAFPTDISPIQFVDLTLNSHKARPEQLGFYVSPESSVNRPKNYRDQGSQYSNQSSPKVPRHLRTNPEDFGFEPQPTRTGTIPKQRRQNLIKSLKTPKANPTTEEIQRYFEGYLERPPLQKTRPRPLPETSTPLQMSPPTAIIGSPSSKSASSGSSRNYSDHSTFYLMDGETRYGTTNKNTYKAHPVLPCPECDHRKRGGYYANNIYIKPNRRYSWP